jgi:hypothetical protein
MSEKCKKWAKMAWKHKKGPGAPRGGCRNSVWKISWHCCYAVTTEKSRRFFGTGGAAMSNSPRAPDTLGLGKPQSKLNYLNTF